MVPKNAVVPTIYKHANCIIAICDQEQFSAQRNGNQNILHYLQYSSWCCYKRSTRMVMHRQNKPIQAHISENSHRLVTLLGMIMIDRLD